MKNTMTYPTVEESFARLHAAGWAIGETGAARVWLLLSDEGHVGRARTASHVPANFFIFSRPALEGGTGCLVPGLPSP